MSSFLSNSKELGNMTQPFIKILLFFLFAFLILSPYVRVLAKDEKGKGEKEASQQDWDWEALPDATKYKIFSQLFTKSSKDGKSLMQTSKSMKSMVEKVSFGSYAVIGSEKKFINTIHLCQQLFESPSRYEQIRRVYITFFIYQSCKFNQSNLRNLQEIHILILKSDESDLLAFSHSSSMKSDPRLISLNKTESCFVTTEQVNTGYLLMKELLLGYSSKVKINVISGGNTGLNLLQNLLMVPSNCKKLELIEDILIHNRTFVDYQDSIGNTPLHFCMLPDFNAILKNIYFDTVDCIRLFLKYGANSNIQNLIGYSSVHVAASLCYSSPLEILVLNGNGDINAENTKLLLQPGFLHTQHAYSHGLSPAHIALLIASGKFKYWDSFKNPCPVYHECYGSIFNVNDIHLTFWKITLLNNTRKKELPIHFLLNRKELDLSSINSHHQTILNTLARFNMLKELEDLLRFRAKEELPLNHEDAFGFTPLLNIVRSGNADIVGMLIKLGSDVNHYAKNGSGVIDINYKNKNSLLIYRLVLENGLDPDAPDGTRKRPLDIVSECTSIYGLNLFLNYNCSLTQRNDKFKLLPLLGKVLLLLHTLYSNQFANSSEYKNEAKQAFNNTIQYILQKLPNPREDWSSHSDLTYIEYYKLLRFTSSFDPQVHQQAIEKTPKQILNTLRYPFITRKGLNYNPQYLDSLGLFNVVNGSYPNNPKLLCDVMMDTKTLFSRVRWVGNITIDLFDKCDLYRSTNLKFLSLEVPDLKMHGARTLIQHYQILFNKISKIVLRYPYRYFSWDASKSPLHQLRIRVLETLHL